MRILIVDDYPGLVELYDLALRARGFDVVGAATASEAMTLAASSEIPFDAVVLDVQLPDGSGPELVRRLRQFPALHTTPVVGISSFDCNGAESHFDAFVSKPCHPRQLASVLRRLCARDEDGERRANSAEPPAAKLA